MEVRRALAALAAIGLLAAGALGTAGCSADSSSSSTRVSAADATGAAAGAKQALAFTGRTLDGKPFDGTSLAGQPAVLWFWAPWCGTCLGQGSSVADVAKKYRGKLGVVGVAGMGDVAAMRDFVADAEVTGVTHLNDESGAVWRRFGITAQSIYVLIDGSGAVIHQGWLDSEQFDAKVAALVV